MASVTWRSRQVFSWLLSNAALYVEIRLGLPDYVHLGLCRMHGRLRSKPLATYQPSHTSLKALKLGPA